MPRASSDVRVLGRSLYCLAVGWLLSMGWLWVAGLQQHKRRSGEWPADFGAGLLIVGALLPTVVAVAMAYGVAMLAERTGVMQTTREKAFDWLRGFWWALIPNVLFALTAYLMIEALK